MTYAEPQNAVLPSLLTEAIPVVVAPEAPPHPPLPRATLSDVTDAVLKILRPDLQQRGRLLVVEVTETSEFLQGDPSPVAQVMADLLDSASRCARTSRVMVRVALQRDDVVITAREDGPGIGLAIARELTERYGRAISCCIAAPGRGSEIVVRVRVPVSEFELAPTGARYDWEAQMLLALAVTWRHDRAQLQAYQPAVREREAARFGELIRDRGMQILRASRSSDPALSAAKG